MTPVLTIISDAIGITGGWVVARFQLQVNSGLYWSSVVKGLYLQDVYGMGLVKPFVFGFIIVSVACHVGMRTTGGTAGVGKATTVAVVAGSVLVIAGDFFVNQILVTLLY
jgi:phospholipid/cholesterol/gamma-HCH transport system permease protein